MHKEIKPASENSEAGYFLQRSHIPKLFIPGRIGVEDRINRHMQQCRFTRINCSLESGG